MANPLMKSATTANISKTSFSSSQKERTPFRIERNKHKYSNSNLNNTDNYDSISTGSSSASTSKLKRSDLLGSASSNDVSYNKLKSHDSGYYDGNYFKSKYEDLLSDVSSNRHTPKKTTAAYTGAATARQLRPYKRTDSSGVDKHRTAINLYEMLENEEKTNGTSSSSGGYRRTYSQRKSTGAGLRSAYNDNPSTTTDDSSDDFADFEKTERENRRKEIQSLIKKYAQLDDFYGGKAGRDDNNNNSSAHKDRNSNNDPWDTKMQSPVVIPMKSANNKPASSSSSFNALAKSSTTANIPHYQSNYDFDSSWYGSNYNNVSKHKGSNVVPITTFAQKSSSKSRMSKALSTFVRIATIYYFSSLSHERVILRSAFVCGFWCD
jgi:hypothetical protein